MRKLVLLSVASALLGLGTLVANAQGPTLSNDSPYTLLNAMPDVSVPATMNEGRAAYTEPAMTVEDMRRYRGR